jgi:hypothetical protein
LVVGGMLLLMMFWFSKVAAASPGVVMSLCDAARAFFGFLGLSFFVLEIVFF